MVNHIGLSSYCSLNSRGLVRLLVLLLGFLVLAAAAPEARAQLPAPTINSVTPGHRQVTVAWTMPSGTSGCTSAVGYNTTGSTSTYTTAASGLTGTSYTVTGLTDGTVTYFAVNITSGGGFTTSAWSTQASTTPAVLTPTGLSATAGVGQVNLAWTAVSGAANYNVKRSTASGGTYSTISSPTGNSYADIQASAGSTYYYKVSALQDASESANSTQQSATLIPVVPTSPAATPANAQVTLSWSASSGATTYNVKRATVSGGSYATVSSPTGASYVDTGRTNGTTYYYVVSAVNAGGESANSSEISATPFAAPAAPTISTTVSGDKQITISWSSASGATSYNVKHNTTGSTTVYTSDATGVAGTIYTVTGLPENTLCYLVVSAVNASGEGANSSQATATTAPAAPIGLAATPTSLQVALSWSAVTGATSYKVKRSTTDGSGYAVVASPSASPYTDTGLTAGVTYFYVVSAVSANGEGSNSNQAAATVTPPVPASPVATAGNAQVTLTWVSSLGATGYTVKRSTVSGSGYATVSSPATNTYINTGLTNSTTYYFVITASNSAGTSANSSEVSATPLPPPPSAPTGVAATGGTLQVVVSWVTVSGATSYSVKRGTVTGGPYTAVGSPAGTTYTDTGLSAGTTYYYVVAGVNSAGPSANSSEVNAITAPAAPGSPGASASGTQISLTWSASTGATGYNVKRAAVTGGPYSTLPASPVGTASYNDTGLATGTAFYYVISALNAGGESANSGEVSGTTIPPTPTGLAATAGAAQVALSWNLTAGTATYNVKRSTISGSGYSTLASPGGTSYTDTGLTPGTSYYYVVSAVNPAGESSNATQVSAVPLLPAPTGVVGTPGDTQVVLNWNSVTGATSYNVWRSLTSGGGYSQVNGSAITPTTYTDTSLTNAITYYYLVYAVDATGQGVASAEINAAPFPATSSTTGYAVNSGGTASGSFIADSYYTGGSTASTAASIDTTAVTSPAPVAVYKSARTGTFTYALNGLSAHSLYTVRLHFAEISGATAGQRVFNITIHGQHTLSVPNLDIYSLAGGANTALVEESDVIPDPSGTITISTTAVTGTPQINGIEVVPATADPLQLAAIAGSTQVTLNWNSYPNQDHYVVQRSTTSTSGPWTTVASSVLGQTYTDTGLTQNTRYYYQVLANVGGTTNGTSNAVSALPGSGQAPAPTGIWVTAQKRHNVVHWSKPQGTNRFDIYRKIGAGAFELLAVQDTGQSYNDIRLIDTVSYCYYVTAVTSDGEGLNSSTVCLTPAGPSPFPAATGLSATGGCSQVALSWSAVTGASNYDIYRSTTSGDFSGAWIATTGSTSYTDTGLLPSTQYYYVVVPADGSGNEGTYSAQFGAITGSGSLISTVTLSASPVTGLTNPTGTVTLSAVAGSDTVIDLSSDNSALASVPSTVTVVHGTQTQTFTVTTSAVTYSTTANITATASCSTVTTPLTVTAPTVSTISLSPTTVVGGQTSTGTLTLGSAAPTGGLVVNVVSSDTHATVAASVTVPAGATSTTFTVTTVPTTAAVTATVSNLNYGAVVTTSPGLTVNPPSTSTLTFAPSTLPGGSISTATVTLTGAAPAGGTLVTLTSASPTVAAVPATVLVPAGQSSALFWITTTAVSSVTVVSITAQAPFGSPISSNLTVNPPSVTGITLNPATVVGGNTSTGTVTLNGPAPTLGTVISFGSSNTTAVPAPSNITIRANASKYFCGSQKRFALASWCPMPPCAVFC